MGQIQVKELLQELKLGGMLNSFNESISQTKTNQTQMIDFLDHLLHKEKEYRKFQLADRLLKTSKLSKRIRAEEIDFTTKRTIGKDQIHDLLKLKWVENERSIVFIGPTGVGKTFLAQTLGHECCQNRVSTFYLDISTYLENLHLSRHSNDYLRYLKKLSRPQVLIIDDFGLRKFSTSEASDFCDLLKSRVEKSTVITTQLPIDHWFEVIEDPVIADTIIDRMIHTAIKIDIKGGSYRKIQGKILDHKELKK